MAKEYNNRRSSRSRNSAPSRFLVIPITFILGYLTASFLDIQKLSQWINTQVLAYHDVTKEVKPEQRQAAIPPKPKFEFYTLLANEKVPNSQLATHATQSLSVANTDMLKTKVVATSNGVNASVAATEAIKSNSPNVIPKPMSTVRKTTEAAPSLPIGSPTERGNYLVQVASFKARQDAEQMKGRLILKGFDVYIIPVNHATKGNWYRVVVGPYTNRGLAQRAQINLARNEHLNGMITPGG